MSFLACRVYKNDKIEHRLDHLDLTDLSEGNVVVRVHYSSINYKDALAATGRGKIMRSFPLNAGIDLAGEVESSEHPDFQPGDKVIANGCGLGETIDGGLAQFARVSGDILMALPSGLSLREAMILGTAGFTAALAVHRMEVNGQHPELGPIAITGASGGVGQSAIAILSKLGYEVVAISSREDFAPELVRLGACKVVSPEAMELGERPLESVRFGGAIDSVGGDLLARLLANTQLWGNLACIGMAASPDLDTTVFPMILRGVSLLGISSTNCPMPLRREIWERLGKDFRPDNLEAILSKEVPLKDVSPVFAELLDRKHHGRLIVNCS